MAESTLTLTWDDLRKAVAFSLGYGRTVANWSANQILNIQDAVDTGYRWVLNPRIQLADKGMLTHSWSWLKPIATVTTSAPYSTGTIAVTNASDTVTLTTGTWPTWANAGEIEVGDVRYDVIERVSSSVIKLATNYLGTTASGQTYTLRGAQILLPDNFGSVEGQVTYASTDWSGGVNLTNEMKIRSLREGSSTTGRPTQCAIRWRTTTATSGQRCEMMFDPIPDAAYVLQFRMNLLMNKLDQAHPYHLGGMKMSETVKAACIAAGDYILNSRKDRAYEEFVTLLQASIADDRRSNAPTYLTDEMAGYDRGRYSTEFQINGVAQ